MFIPLAYCFLESFSVTGFLSEIQICAREVLALADDVFVLHSVCHKQYENMLPCSGTESDHLLLLLYEEELQEKYKGSMQPFHQCAVPMSHLLPFPEPESSKL